MFSAAGSGGLMGSRTGVRARMSGRRNFFDPPPVISGDTPWFVPRKPRIIPSARRGSIASRTQKPIGTRNGEENGSTGKKDGPGPYATHKASPGAGKKEGRCLFGDTHRDVRTVGRAIHQPCRRTAQQALAGAGRRLRVMSRPVRRERIGHCPRCPSQISLTRSGTRSGIISTGGPCIASCTCWSLRR